MQYRQLECVYFTILCDWNYIEVKKNEICISLLPSVVVKKIITKDECNAVQIYSCQNKKKNNKQTNVNSNHFQMHSFTHTNTLRLCS